MLYNSTQNAAEVVSSAQAIAQGISKDGGLFVPSWIPGFESSIEEMSRMDLRSSSLLSSAILL